MKKKDYKKQIIREMMKGYNHESNQENQLCDSLL